MSRPRRFVRLDPHDLAPADLFDRLPFADVADPDPTALPFTDQEPTMTTTPARFELVGPDSTGNVDLYDVQPGGRTRLNALSRDDRVELAARLLATLEPGIALACELNAVSEELGLGTVSER